MQQHPAAIGEKAAGVAGLLAARIQGHLMQTGRNIQSILITIVISGLAKVNRVVVVVGAYKLSPPSYERESVHKIYQYPLKMLILKWCKNWDAIREKHFKLPRLLIDYASPRFEGF
ncbi:hypothetical protein T10_13426 [Trichinella papuae]|uniref:Uncharacterized protein n=1 Tax=Trichinella papuae TaxID=268474 RepID=A0A0V1MUV5_9BILA|nr:hypothetical protein T10_13426 [Trichinella papuae]